MSEPTRNIEIEVSARGKGGQLSYKAAILAASNPQPRLPTALKIEPGHNVIEIGFGKPVDLDFAGTIVWLSRISGFEPSDDNMVKDGSDLSMIATKEPGGAPLVAGTKYYVRVAHYDAFGKTGLNVSSEYEAETILINGNELEPFTVPSAAIISLKAGKIEAESIISNLIYLGLMRFDGENSRITVDDNQNPPRRRINFGDIGPLLSDFGIEIFNKFGKLVLGSDGIGTKMVGELNVDDAISKRLAPNGVAYNLPMFAPPGHSNNMEDSGLPFHFLNVYDISIVNYSNHYDLTGVVPFNNGIPTQPAGGTYIFIDVKPLSATSLLTIEVEALVYGTPDKGMALFSGETINAIAATGDSQSGLAKLSICHREPAGNTELRRYKIYFLGGATMLNKTPTLGTLFGFASKTSIKVTEVRSNQAIVDPGSEVVTPGTYQDRTVQLSLSAGTAILSGSGDGGNVIWYGDIIRIHAGSELKIYITLDTTFYPGRSGSSGEPRATLGSIAYSVVSNNTIIGNGTLSSAAIWPAAGSHGEERRAGSTNIISVILLGGVAGQAYAISIKTGYQQAQQAAVPSPYYTASGNARITEIVN